MKSLTAFLQERIAQLEHRLMMIPRYVERPESFLGKNDFSLEDLPKIQYDIEEAKAALSAIQKLKLEKKLTSKGK